MSQPTICHHCAFTLDASDCGPAEIEARWIPADDDGPPSSETYWICRECLNAGAGMSGPGYVKVLR